MKKVAIVLAALVFAAPVFVGLLGCGTEVGRIPFAGEGSASSTIPLKAGDVAFWTDIDIEYQGPAAVAYQIELSQGGAKVATATCDPLGRINQKSTWIETNIGDSHSRRGNGKMGCAATLTAGGPTLVTAKLAFARKPASLTLKKADLALRQ